MLQEQNVRYCKKKMADIAKRKCQMLQEENVRYCKKKMADIAKRKCQMLQVENVRCCKKKKKTSDVHTGTDNNKGIRKNGTLWTQWPDRSDCALGSGS